MATATPPAFPTTAGTFSATILSRSPSGPAREAPTIPTIQVPISMAVISGGMADLTRPITSDVLFNLGSVGKVFDTALLTLAEQKGELNLDDPVAKYVVELQQGGDVRRITLRQLASYTSGFVLPQDHAPWPKDTFTLPEFVVANCRIKQRCTKR
jgi:CubicO group peptidase (beta-lactamase class C family)